jgi:hypothetical protein
VPNVVCVSRLFFLDFVFFFFFFFLVFFKNEEKLKKIKIKNEQSRHNQHWAQDKNEEKLKKTKSRMNNLETQSTLGTRQGQRKTKEKQNSFLFLFFLFFLRSFLVSIVDCVLFVHS